MEHRKSRELLGTLRQSDNQQPSGQRMKTCKHCGVEKAISEFYFRQSSNSFETWCKECSKCRSLEYHVANRHKVLVRQRLWKAMNKQTLALKRKAWILKKYGSNEAWLKSLRTKVKDEVFKAYGGYICACCGEMEETFLTIDHINNDGHIHRRDMASKKGGSGFFAWLRKHKFPAGFQVLCRNCNWSKHVNHGVCSHMLAEGSTTRRKPYTQASGSAGYPEMDSEIVWSAEPSAAAARRFGTRDPK
jgi:hypothetical protein